MNIITKADVDKFLVLLKAGLKEGKQKDLKIYTSTSVHDGTNVPKGYYVNLEFSFRCDADAINDLLIEQDFDVSNNINDLLK